MERSSLSYRRYNVLSEKPSSRTCEKGFNQSISWIEGQIRGISCDDSKANEKVIKLYRLKGNKKFLPFLYPYSVYYTKANKFITRREKR